MTKNERLKQVRKALHLNQEDFGRKIGLKKTSISTIEKGVNNVTELVAKSICREYNVDYFWLTEGKGEMFTKVPETLLEQIAEKYKLSDRGKIILKTYVDAPRDQQNAIENYLLQLLENMKKGGE